MINLSNYILMSIDEARVVPFRDVNGRIKKFGQCIILGGGPGIGKGFIRKNYLDTDYKVFNVDDLKDLYIDMVKAGIYKDKEYDLKNPKDVSALHGIIAKKGWKQKERERVLDKSHIANLDRLPNVCFDITAKDPKAFEEIFDQVIDLGYEVTFVWVIGNIDVARANNQKRDRTVPEELLLTAHNSVNSFIPDLLSNKYPEISEKIGRAFICLSAGNGHELSDEWSSSPVIEVKKHGNKFDYDAVKDSVRKFMSEIQPEKPKKDK